MNDFAQQHAAFLPLTFTGVVITLWVGVSFITSYMAGWWGLAQRYRTEKPFPDHKRWMQSGMMRAMTRYRRVMTVGSDTEGIYLSMQLICRIGCPPLFVPWADIEIEGPRPLFLFMMQTLRLGPDRIPLRLRESLVDFLREGRGAGFNER